MTRPQGLEWLLSRAEPSDSTGSEELSRELESYTVHELCGLVYHCRLYNPFWWATTDEEAEDADYRWMHLEFRCRRDLKLRGVQFVPHDPEFGEQLASYAAFLKRMALVAEYPPDADFNDHQHRGVFANGLVAIFTRYRDTRGLYAHLSISAMDRIPSAQEIEGVVEALFGGWRGVTEGGFSGGRIRHFVKPYLGEN